MINKPSLPAYFAFCGISLSLFGGLHGQDYVYRGYGLKRGFEVSEGGQAAKALGEAGELVMYEVGKPHDEAHMRIATSEVLFQGGKDGVLASAELRGLGLKVVKDVEFLSGWYVARFASAKKAMSAVEVIHSVKGVEHVELLLKKKPAKRSAPADPLYAYDALNSGYQWHLKNTGQNGGVAGIDINVESVWSSYTGSGVKVAIVDDGLQTSHPDLNADTSIDHNWNDGDENDPSPTSGERHGTSAAGVAAARAGNSIGGVGVAYDSLLVGLRLVAGAVSDLDISQALGWQSSEIDIYSNSWGPADAVSWYEGAGALTRAVLADRAANGRGGKGSIYVWAGGNGQRVYLASSGVYAEDNSNYDGYANLMETIAVGSVDDEGLVSSERGANIVVVAPSSGGVGSQGITTTDLVANGGYRYDFGGTSAATPQVSGIVALMLEANPNLGWRDVQEILMTSAKRVDSMDGDWSFNGGGYAFNHKYGAGLVDAAAAVSLAQGWSNLAARSSQEISLTGLSDSIPDFTVNGLSKTFDASALANLRVEHVEVEVDITHAYVGDLEVTLVSPSGTRSVLSENNFSNGQNLSWTFMSVHHWGESSQGTWKVEVRDLGVGDSGTLNSIKLRLHGVPQAVGAVAPRLAGDAALEMTVGKPFLFQLNSPDSVSSYAISNLPSGVYVDHDGLVYGVPEAAGEGVATVTLTNANGSSNNHLYFKVRDDLASSVAGAVDWENKAFTTSGSLSWSVDETVSNKGGSSAVIGGLQDYEQATLGTDVVGPGVLTFDWKVSSEVEADFLELLVDGVVVERISGVANWSQVTRAIPAGSHLVEWRYSKDYSTSGNLDRAWVDDVSYVQTGSYEEWAAGEFSALELEDDAVSGAGADPDGDKVTNLMEFFLASDPNVRSVPPVLEYHADGGLLEIGYQVPSGITGVVHGFEYSDDLVDWHFIGSDFSSESGGVESRMLTLPQDQERRFYRLKVIQ